MTLIHQAGGDDFTNYFLVFAQEGKSIEEQAETIFDREGVVELCHNHGTESDASFKGYANGNEDPGRGSCPLFLLFSCSFSGENFSTDLQYDCVLLHSGFGHLCISTGSVSLEDACKRFTDLGVEFKKRPEEGRVCRLPTLFIPGRRTPTLELTLPPIFDADQPDAPHRLPLRPRPILDRGRRRQHKGLNASKDQEKEWASEEVEGVDRCSL